MQLLSLLLLASPGVATPACPVGAQWSMRPLALRNKNVVRISDGQLVFNGARLSDDMLRQLLQASARTSPRPRQPQLTRYPPHLSATDAKEMIPRHVPAEPDRLRP